jgi:putative glutathione S-transferase
MIFGSQATGVNIMGKLVEGIWRDEWYDTDSTGGKFVRENAGFRDWVEESGRFAPESGRYHLYVSMACPWAHRALVMRKLKSLEEHIAVSVVQPHMLEHGWTYDPPEPLYGFARHHQLYTRAQPDFTGRVTVPVLWDTRHETIVNNESADIMRIFNSAFNGLTGNTDDYYPQSMRKEIDRVNSRVYDDINNGVYKTGFATRQDAYTDACVTLFGGLDWVEGLLANHRYLVGERITEADWRLFTTLLRFDPVYHGHFKCNVRRIEDYPNITGYLRELYQQPGIEGTVDMEQIKQHYYFSHDTINPTRIVPLGNGLDLTLAHGRG